MEIEDTGILSPGSWILRTCLTVCMSSVHWEGKSEISTSPDMIGSGLSCLFIIEE